MDGTSSPIHSDTMLRTANDQSASYALKGERSVKVFLSLIVMLLVRRVYPVLLDREHLARLGVNVDNFYWNVDPEGCSVLATSSTCIHPCHAIGAKTLGLPWHPYSNMGD